MKDSHERAWQIALDVASPTLTQADVFSVAATCKSLKTIVDSELASLAHLRGGENALGWLEKHESSPLKMTSLSLTVPWTTSVRVTSVLQKAVVGLDTLIIVFTDEHIVPMSSVTLPARIFESIGVVGIASTENMLSPSSSNIHSIVVEGGVPISSPLLRTVTVFGFKNIDIRHVCAPNLKQAIYDGMHVWMPRGATNIDEVIFGKTTICANIDEHVIVPNMTGSVVVCCDSVDETRVETLSRELANASPKWFRLNVHRVCPTRIPSFVSSFQHLRVLDIRAPSIESGHDLDVLMDISHLSIVVFRGVGSLHTCQRAVITSHPFFTYAYESSDELVSFTRRSGWNAFTHTDSFVELEPCVFHWICELPDAIDTVAVQTMLRDVPTIRYMIIWQIESFQSVVDKFAALPHQPTCTFMDIGGEMVVVVCQMTIVRS
jgi:hypothetical protein